MLAIRRNTSQLYDVCMLDCTNSLHDLICGWYSVPHKQLSTGLNCCPDLVVQSAETRLRDMQTLVQQEAGVLLDRQRITIEGIQTANPNHASARLTLACLFLCMLHFHLHLCIIAVSPSMLCVPMAFKLCKCGFCYNAKLALVIASQC